MPFSHPHPRRGRTRRACAVAERRTRGSSGTRSRAPLDNCCTVPSPEDTTAERRQRMARGTLWLRATKCAWSGLLDPRLGSAPADIARDRERLAGDPVRVLEQRSVHIGEREPDAVGELEPSFLSHRVHRVDQVVHPAAHQKALVQLEIERHGHAVRGRHRPPFLAATLDENLSGGELVPSRTKATVRKLLELARHERGANGPELLPELRPEQPEVRLYAELARIDLPQGDIFDAQFP